MNLTLVLAKFNNDEGCWCPLKREGISMSLQRAKKEIHQVKVELGSKFCYVVSLLIEITLYSYVKWDGKKKCHSFCAITC